MSTDVPAYGLWPLVIMNALVFIIFAFSFTRPHTARDWRSFGAFSAFVHAWVLVAVANAAHAAHVPHPGDDVRAAGTPRGT